MRSPLRPGGLLLAALLTVAQADAWAVPGSQRLTGPSPASGAPKPSAPTQAAPASWDAVPQEDSYIIGPGDTLQLRFLAATTKDDPLSGPLEVLSDGTATLPLLGSVRLAGLTLGQAGRWLETLYRRQLLRPELQLSLERPRPLRVALVGEVERPGVYTLTTTETSQTQATVPITGLPTLVDAIQKAGGLTPVADLRKVVLRRRLPGEGPPSYRRTSVNLLDLVQEGDLVQNPILFDGDTIRVPRAKESVIEATELAATTLAPREIAVNVIGEVERPGPVAVRANTPLVQAVLAAGGPRSWRANTGRVQLVRINRNGTVTRQAFPLDLGAAPSARRNPILQDRDTVLVTRSNYAKLSDAITAIGTPLTGLVNIVTLFTLVQDLNDNGN